MSESAVLLRIREADNVAIALRALVAGETLSLAGTKIRVAEAVEPGHKIAIQAIASGRDIVKYGYPIGHATQAIPAGAWVHTHNLATNLKGKLDYQYHPVAAPPPAPELGDLPGSFRGYLRADGSVGIRNEVWIINTVGCVNKTAEILARNANQSFAGRCDGVFTFSHPYGCSQLGEDHQTTKTILADLARHPNASAVLILGLGCENNHIADFRKLLTAVEPRRIRYLSTQEAGDEIEVGMRLLDELTAWASTLARVELPVSKLVVGLKCGGSDGFSGITANPVVGAFSDLLVAKGGSSMLTEVPEMFGAETILMDRCHDQATFEATVGLINGFKDYFIRHNQEVYENPSPGNKAGGISTLEEKSLGCTQKGGNSLVRDVLDYGARVRQPGLSLLRGPGNDAVAVTALAAAACHIVLFTTGRGNPLGGPVPTLKISSNSDLAQRKGSWIDFDAGQLLAGKSLDTLGRELYRQVVDCASGTMRARNEVNGYREIAIFKDGVTL